MTLFAVVTAMLLTAVVTTAPKIAHAAGDDACSLFNGVDWGCNIFTVPNPSGEDFAYGTFLFKNVASGAQKEGFCIETGLWAYLADASSNQGALPFTAAALDKVGVPEKGFGDTSRNATYVASTLIAMYASGALDGLVSLSAASSVNVAARTSPSNEHVVAAGVLAYILHAWFDTKANPSYFASYMNSFPGHLMSVVQSMLAAVPALSPQVFAARVAYRDGASYLALQVPNGAAYTLEPALPVVHRGANFIVVPYTRGSALRVCQPYSYAELIKAGHTRGGARSQASIEALAGATTSGQLCSGEIRLDDGFGITLNSSAMLTQRYAQGDISDVVNFSHTSVWPCDAFSDPLGTPGACGINATFPMQAALFMRESLTAQDGGNALTTVNESSPYATAATVLSKPTSGASGAQTVTFSKSGGFPPGFFTAQASVSVAGNISKHPQNINAFSAEVLRETASTYKCDLQHTSHTSNYSITAGQSVQDTITIDGRCRKNALVDGAFEANDTAEIRLYGPLKALPARNAPGEEPQLSCLVSSPCVYAQKEVPLQNASFTYGSFGEQLKPITEGLYVFVYHFPGDVFTPEFWSDASDGDETFYVEGEHVQMWSKATSSAAVGSPIQDTVYISGTLRPGAYLTFSAFRAEPEGQTPACASPLPSFTSDPVLVGLRGGVYKSPETQSFETGNVYWVATLHEADGSVYKDYYLTEQGGYYHEIQGLCGEAEETSHIVWDVELTSDATKTAQFAGSGAHLVSEGDINEANALGAGVISDTLHINMSASAGYDAIPEGFTYEFNAYLENGSVPGALAYSSGRHSLATAAQASIALGDVSFGGEGGAQIGAVVSIPSPSFAPSSPGVYRWVATLYDQFGEVYLQGVYGDPRETSYVFEITSDVSQSVIQKGSKLHDQFHISGSVPDGAILRPLVWKACQDDSCAEDFVHQTLSDIALRADVNEYTTQEFDPQEVGSYYITFELYFEGELIAVGEKNDARESFQAIDITSESPPERYAGEAFSDTVYLHGAIPPDTCVYFDLYYQYSTQDSLALDRLVEQTECIVPQGDTVYSPAVSEALPGTYYWVAYLKRVADGHVYAKGRPRDPSETTTVKPLTNSAWLYSETPSSVLLGERFADTVNITGRIPEDGWVVWSLYKQNERASNPIEDKLIQISAPKHLKDGKLFKDDGLLHIVSDDVSLDQEGVYYWVEALYSPLQSEPVAIGEPRLENETVRVKAHTGMAVTSSRAVHQIEAGQEAWDVVYVRCNLGEFSACLKNEQGDRLLQDGYVSWKVYRKDLHSSRALDDTLLFEMDPLPLSAGQINEHGELEIQSKRVVFDTPGVYYWVEALCSPMQDAPVSLQEMRQEQETTIVDSNSAKFTRIGAKRNAVTLASTGVALGKLAGTAAVLTTLAIMARLRRCNARKRRFTLTGGGYWVY
jgi:hypothetical protein